MAKCVSLMCWVTGFGLSASLLVLWLTARVSDTSGQVAAADQAMVLVPDVECGPLSAGDVEHAVSVTVINRGDRPVRLIGGSAGCVGHTCHQISITGLVLVHPGTEVQIAAKLKVGIAEPFDDGFEIFFDDGTMRSVTARFRGYGVSR